MKPKTKTKNSIPNLKFAENLSSFYRPTKHHIIQIYTYFIMTKPELKTQMI